MTFLLHFYRFITLFLLLSSALQAAEPLVVATQHGAVTLEVEVADTPQAQAQGLMHRKWLSPDAGMLFVVSPPRPMTMWMKNTYIPLDMLFIDANATIASIAANTTPLSEKRIHSAGAVAAVLEINGGAAAKLGIRSGDRVSHPLLGAGQ